MFFTGLLLTLGSLPTEVKAENSRLELGRRLKRFEITWETATPERRASAVPFLKTAVRKFFTLSLLEAGSEMDKAWLALNPEINDSQLTRALIGSQLVASPICADTRQEGDQITLKLKRFYGEELQPPSPTQATLRLESLSGQLHAETQIAVPSLILGTTWNIAFLPEADYKLTLTFEHNGTPYSLPPITISRIHNLRQRLAILADAATKLKNDSKTSAGTATASALDGTVAATLQSETRLFRDVLDGLSQEADFPYLKRIKNCEALLSACRQSKEAPYQTLDSGEYWLTLAEGFRTIPTRIQLPTNREHPAPVLFVLHGAGGSENMFFETYGAGRVVTEAAKRGWVVVSPRQSLLGLSLDIEEMLSAVETITPIDRRQVMLLGHSMGAAQIVQQVGRHPNLPVAAVALGGGRRFSSRQPAKTVEWYLAAGSEDFGISSVRQLNESLVEIKARVDFKIYNKIEHLVIVQAAIDDSFSFLDQVLAKQDFSQPSP